MQLTNRTILITGASSGIGAELAIALAGRGSRVVLSGRDPARLQQVASATGGAVIEADLATSEGVLALAEQVRCRHSDLSIVINNAAMQLNYLLGQGDQDPARAVADIADELQTDLAAPIQLIALLLPTLQQQAIVSNAPSAVVNLTSGLALAPKKTAAVYCAAKAGLRAFTTAWRFQADAARRAGGPDVRAVEAMLPMVDTPMTTGRGRGKITARQAAHEIIEGLEKDRTEINVGKVRALRILYRLSPHLTQQMFRNA